MVFRSKVQAQVPAEVVKLESVTCRTHSQVNPIETVVHLRAF